MTLDDFDIAPELQPDDPLWARLMLCRVALEHAAGTFWEYTVGEFHIAANETPLVVHVQAPRPFEIPPHVAIVFGGGGVYGYIGRERSRLTPAGRDVAQAIIEETCRERADIIRKARLAVPLFRGPVCEGCGVPLGEFAGDRFNADRSGGVCQQCLTFGRGWLNREPKRFG